MPRISRKSANTLSKMPIAKKQIVKKRGRSDGQLLTPSSAKKQRALSPLRNADHEEDSRTREKIIVSLRAELAEARSEARDAAEFKQQRDFVVHIAASLNNLQGEMLEAWHGDVQKLAGTRGFKKALNDFNVMEDRAVAIEELCKDFPQLDRSLRAKVGALEVDAIKGQVEDFEVVMVEKDDDFTNDCVSD
jgi:hypothetical protein